jgi:flagellum-specific ATP synthase
MGMIARNTNADVNVITLIGERGREVREFIEKDLGTEGLKKSVVVVATSDKSALIRVKGAFIGTTIAEYFRDKGKDVVLMMDSVTRFAMAQREIGLTVGEPPTTKGYTPSVFAILPKLLERAGTKDKGSITGFYTVLVDGDDMTEPIADAVRSILDGHVVLSRKLANKGQFPAVDPLQSVSRVMPDIVSKDHRMRAIAFNEILATYREAEDLINIGAYVKGSNPQIDHALSKIRFLRSYLKQDVSERSTFDQAVKQLKEIIEEPLQ